MKNGFSLIELLVAIGIMVVIFSLGLIVDTRFYRSANLATERDTVASLLSRSRSDALNNVDQKNHGFYVASSSYVIFEGDAYATRNSAYDEIFPAGAGIIASGVQEIDFKALEGSVLATGTITLANDTRSLSIAVNGEGAILW
jgi:prepilin-type N-terminal cleavage/methylation domain-containing protein